MSSRLHRGGWLRDQALRAVLERDGPMCGRCGRYIDLGLSGLAPDGPTLGHVIPAEHGGSDDLANLRPEHRRCNLAASSRPDPPRAVIAAPLPWEG